MSSYVYHEHLEYKTPRVNPIVKHGLGVIMRYLLGASVVIKVHGVANNGGGWPWSRQGVCKNFCF